MLASKTDRGGATRAYLSAVFAAVDMQRVPATPSSKRVLVRGPVETTGVFAVTSYASTRSLRSCRTVSGDATVRVGARNVPRKVIAAVHTDEKAVVIAVGRPDLER